MFNIWICSIKTVHRCLGLCFNIILFQYSFIHFPYQVFPVQGCKGPQSTPGIIATRQRITKDGVTTHRRHLLICLHVWFLVQSFAYFSIYLFMYLKYLCIWISIKETSNKTDMWVIKSAWGIGNMDRLQQHREAVLAGQKNTKQHFWQQRLYIIKCHKAEIYGRANRLYLRPMIKDAETGVGSKELGPLSNRKRNIVWSAIFHSFSLFHSATELVYVWRKSEQSKHNRMSCLLQYCLLRAIPECFLGEIAVDWHLLT